jgi:hypothetical protein
MKQKSLEWLLVTFILVFILFLWVFLAASKVLVMLPVGIVALFKEKSVVLGTTVCWRVWFSSMVRADNHNINTALGGDRNTSLSNRVGTQALKGVSMAIKLQSAINLLFFWENNHCKEAINKDRTNLKSWSKF